MEILNQPISGLSGPQVPGISDLTHITSEAIQFSGDTDSLQPAPIDLPQNISFFNGKYEVFGVSDNGTSLGLVSMNMQ